MYINQGDRQVQKHCRFIYVEKKGWKEKKNKLQIQKKSENFEEIDRFWW